MRITVAPRYVAAPWEDETCRRIVGMEDDVRPEPGPLEAYLAVFEHRVVRWDRAYQSFAVYHVNPGEPEQLIERLTYWDSAPDPITGKELTDEQIAKMAGRDESIVRRFMPLDYQWVNQRLKGRYQVLHEGNDKYRQRILDRNLQRSRTMRRDHARNMAAAANEVKDWLPVLGDYERTGRWNPGMRRAMSAGANFSVPQPAAPAAGLITVVSR